MIGITSHVGEEDEKCPACYNLKCGDFWQAPKKSYRKKEMSGVLFGSTHEIYELLFGWLLFPGESADGKMVKNTFPKM